VTDPLKILVVCTANVCRSPMGEFLLRAMADQRGLAVDVSSSGFMTNGDPASPRVQEVMAARGYDLSAHASRCSTPKILESADLIVTMERRHGRDLSLMLPSAQRRIFTLGRVVDLLAEPTSDGTTAIDRLADLGANRVAGDLLGEGPDEVDDPFAKSLRVHRQTADRLTSLCAGLLVGLFGSTEG